MAALTTAVPVRALAVNSVATTRAQRHEARAVSNACRPMAAALSQRHVSALSGFSVQLQHGFYQKKASSRPRGQNVTRASADAASVGEGTAGANEVVDVIAIVRYFAATGLQVCFMMGALYVLQFATTALASTSAPVWTAKVMVGLFFAVCSIKSRIFSLLDNSRPTIQKDGKKMNVMDNRKRPSWMPPPLAFPIIWSTIGLLRTISSVLVWEACGRNLLVMPLGLMMLHLAIGDTWNTINNVERRMGTAVVGVALVWLSVVAVDRAYFAASTLAGGLLAPSVVWLSVASFLVYTIWDLNGNAPLLPMKAR